MQIRPPAVDGRFYEASPERLRQEVRGCLPQTAIRKERFIGAVVPHAALMYSGRVAGEFYAAAEIPRRLIILCPNHTGLGHHAAINREGAWRTPLGDASIDSALADALMKKTTLLREDVTAHAREHSLEVQLPFLQQLLGGDFTFVPICLGAARYDYCEEIGEAIAAVVKEAGEPIGLIASSDLNHYEDQKTTLEKDQLAIDQVLALDPQQLWRVIFDDDVSMCGFIPTAAMLIAAKELGAKQAKLLKHATSGDVNGDYRQVVGYASIVIQ